MHLAPRSHRIGVTTQPLGVPIVDRRSAPAHASEAELLQAIAEGSEPAFEEFRHRYRRAVERACRSVVGSEEEDCAQEVLVLLAGRLHLSLIHPATRHALSGITCGSVDAEWARRHHPRWSALADDPRAGPEGGDGEPERLVKRDRLPALGDAGRADVAAARDQR